jgi:hypothetical protein
MAVKGWTEVYVGDRTGADVLRAVLRANGLHPSVLGQPPWRSTVLVPDAEAGDAVRLVRQSQERIKSR